MEDTKIFCKFLEDISKRVRFYNPPSAYIFTKRSTPSEENFNDYAKILITPILYKRTTTEAYLEPGRTSTMELFLQKKPSAAFSKMLYRRCLTGF